MSSTLPPSEPPTWRPDTPASGQPEYLESGGGQPIDPEPAAAGAGRSRKGW